MTGSTLTPTELKLINKFIFQPCGLTMAHEKSEQESQEYDAQNFDLDHLKVKYRKAKITPTKIGQFVTLWYRNSAGVTAPYAGSNPIDFYIIATRKDKNLGLFIFPRIILLKHGILKGEGKDGKRGFRVYPNWDIVQNRQAKQTQLWQKLYFIEILANQDVDLVRAKHLLQI